MYGDDGEKYSSGGILIRKAKDWFVQTQTFEGHSTCSKLARMNIQNLSFLRNKFPGVLVPLGCMIDYFGIRYECQSLCPITLNSLIYGTDNEGITIENYDLEAENLAVNMS